MGRKRKTDTRKILRWAVPILVILVLALFMLNEVQDRKELDKIYSTFTCGCCESTLLASDEICSVGFKEVIEQYQEDGLHGQDLFHTTTQLMGHWNIIDPDLRVKAVEHFMANPPTEGPQLVTYEDGIDLGNVSESKTPIVLKDFRIKNNGTKDLLIHRVDTSCSCLSAKFLTEDWESPEYGRFSNPKGMVVSIPPGEELRIRVQYDARINSFFRGYELRHVRVYSNDVMRPVKVFNIEATHVD